MTSNFNKRKLTDLQKSNTKVPNCSFKRVKGEVRNEVQGVQVQELIKEETKEEFDNLNGICIKKEPKSDSELKTYETDKKEDDLSLLTDYKKFLFVASNLKKRYKAPVSSLKKFLFSKEPGLKKHPKGGSPLEFFDFLLTEKFYKYTIEQSNKHAKASFESKETANSPKFSLLRKDITISELRTFIGLILHMGTIKTLKFKDFWKKHRLFNLTCFSNHMSKARFSFLLQHLYFTQTSKSDDHSYDCYQELNWIVAYFNEKMEEVYYPDQELYLNESTVLEGGQLGYYSVKSDVKLYLLSARNGPILRMMVQREEDVLKVEKQSMIVFNLMEGLLDNGHSLFLTSKFTNLDLTSQLLIRNTHSTGFLPDNRKPNILDKVGLKRGEASYICSNDVIVAKWKGEKDFFFVSSEYPTHLMYSVKTPKQVLKPMALYKLKEVEEDVESNNKILRLFASEKGNLPWFKKLAIHMVEILLLNAWHLYNRNGQKQMTFYDFRLSVIENILYLKTLQYHRPSVGEEILERNELSSPLAADPLSLDSYANLENHLPLRENKRKRCRQCSKLGLRKDTHIYCPQCDGKPGLCLHPCFRIYHER